MSSTPMVLLGTPQYPSPVECNQLLDTKGATWTSFSLKTAPPLRDTGGTPCKHPPKHRGACSLILSYVSNLKRLRVLDWEESLTWGFRENHLSSSDRATRDQCFDHGLYLGYAPQLHLRFGHPHQNRILALLKPGCGP